MGKCLQLDTKFIREQKAEIEAAVLPVVEKLYLHDGVEPPDEFRPERKEIERIVSYYDYWQCGVSVLAHLAADDGNGRALALMEKIRANCDHYRENIYNHDCPGRDGVWAVPLRRLLFHLALAYERLLPVLGEEQTAWCRELIEQQVPVAIEHCDSFLPGVKDLHLTFVNNHTAIFMQGVYYCGRALGRNDWQDLALEFAERYYENGHPDGYWEEFSNEAREGGPSMVYTRLTAACLYDVLDGKNNPREKFAKAGSLARQWLNHAYGLMPIADERTNHDSLFASYGMALQSLSPEGRGLICDVLGSMDYGAQSPETLAVIHHELGLMTEGNCATPENRREGSFRITLPLGVLRGGGFTAGISALRALNREIRPASDYALDHQAMVYLAHEKTGVILSGIKSKRNPDFSTFRAGDDAYTVKTGELAMGEDWAEAKLCYETFEAAIRWELGEAARLILRADTGETVRTALSIASAGSVRTNAEYRIEEHPGFSPYTAGNRTDPVKMLVAEWRGELVIEFVV